MECAGADVLFGTPEGREGTKRYYYGCSIKYLKRLIRSDIELSKAKHVAGKNKDQVKAVIIANSTTHFMPTKLADHFMFLVALSICDCELREISAPDLQPFAYLEELLVSGNDIESLPADLFISNPGLEILSCRNNKIRFISPQTLEPLKRLTYADFRGNTNIDLIYSSDGVTLNTLKANIALYCPEFERSVPTVPNYVERLYQGEFSDFKIIAGSKVFAVHKNILAANSPVFAAMFSHGMEENVKSEMTMEHCFAESIKEFVDFVYLRKIPQKCFNAADLYAMSEKYQLTELSAIVQWLVVLEVNAATASAIFKIGNLYNNKVIKEAAFQEIEKMFGKKLPEKVLDDATIMTEILEAKDKLDEVVEGVFQFHL